MLSEFQQKLINNMNKIMKERDDKNEKKTSKKIRKQSKDHDELDIIEGQKLFQQISDDLPPLKEQHDEDSDNQMDVEQKDSPSVKDQQQSSQQDQDSDSKIKTDSQKRIQSILKATVQSIQNKKQERKSVSFDIKDDKSNNAENVFTGTRKWKQKLKNPKKGKFDMDQESALKNSLSAALLEYGITFQQAIQSLSEEEDKVPRNLRLWTKVCSVLPDRTLPSSYKFLKRLLCTKNNSGPWTEEETDTLLNLIQKNGRKWSLISRLMNRTAQNIRDKYRSLGEENNEQIQKQFWSLEELITFVKYLKKYSKVDFLDEKIYQQLQNSQHHDRIEKSQRSKRRYNSKSFTFHNNQVVRKYINNNYNSIKIEDINWKKISDKLVTKTIFDCRNKFVQLLQLQIFSMPAKNMLDREIVGFVSSQKVRNQGQIEWKKWGNKHQISFIEAKNRFMVLKKIVLGRKQKQFRELLSILQQKVK